jgi:hypothetical protein
MLDFHLFKLLCFIRLSCNEMKDGINPYSLTIAPSYPDMRSSESIQELGPTTALGEVRTVRSGGRVAPD